MEIPLRNVVASPSPTTPSPTVDAAANTTNPTPSTTSIDTPTVDTATNITNPATPTPTITESAYDLAERMDLNLDLDPTLISPSSPFVPSPSPTPTPSTTSVDIPVSPLGDTESTSRAFWEYYRAQATPTNFAPSPSPTPSAVDATNIATPTPTTPEAFEAVRARVEWYFDPTKPPTPPTPFEYRPTRGFPEPSTPTTPYEEYCSRRGFPTSSTPAPSVDIPPTPSPEAVPNSIPNEVPPAPSVDIPPTPPTDPFFNTDRLYNVTPSPEAVPNSIPNEVPPAPSIPSIYNPYSLPTPPRPPIDPIIPPTSGGGGGGGPIDPFWVGVIIAVVVVAGVSYWAYKKYYKEGDKKSPESPESSDGSVNKEYKKGDEKPPEVTEPSNGSVKNSMDDPLEQFEVYSDLLAFYGEPEPSYFLDTYGFRRELSFNEFCNLYDLSLNMITTPGCMFFLIRLIMVTWFVKPTILSTWETQDYWMTKNQKDQTGYNVWWQDLGFRVQSALKQNIQLKNSKRGIYWVNLFSSFFTILHANLFGLFPYAFTLTASFALTFFFASNTFIGSFFVGLYIWDWKFVNITAPGGVMIEIIVFLIVIEFISYIARLFSLSIRLFANMMSGHALLKILIGFSYIMLKSINIFFWIMAVIIWVLITLIMFLEVLIAFLQAYIFMVLSMIYLNDVFAFH